MGDALAIDEEKVRLDSEPAKRRSNHRRLPQRKKPGNVRKRVAADAYLALAKLEARKREYGHRAKEPIGARVVAGVGTCYQARSRKPRRKIHKRRKPCLQSPRPRNRGLVAPTTRPWDRRFPSLSPARHEAYYNRLREMGSRKAERVEQRGSQAGFEHRSSGIEMRRVLEGLPALSRGAPAPLKLLSLRGSTLTAKPATKTAIPAEPGAYVLCCLVERPIRVDLGGLGGVALSGGIYLYAGSARRGIRYRCQRYLDPGRGRGRWHIDKLLRRPGARALALVPLPGQSECELVGRLARLGLEAPVAGFGASDCRQGCQAHLLFLRGYLSLP